MKTNLKTIFLQSLLFVSDILTSTVIKYVFHDQPIAGSIPLFSEVFQFL